MRLTPSLAQPTVTTRLTPSLAQPAVHGSRLQLYRHQRHDEAGPTHGVAENRVERLVSQPASMWNVGPYFSQKVKVGESAVSV